MSLDLTDDHERLSEFQAEYIDRYIALADTKAAFAFGVIAGSTGYIVTNDNVRAALAACDFGLYFSLALTSIILLLSAGGAALTVVIPRTWLSPRDGIVSWPAVAKFPDAESYLRRFSAASSEEIRKARASHCFDLARICARKNQWVARTYLLTAVALLVSGAVVLTAPGSLPSLNSPKTSGCTAKTTTTDISPR